MRRYCHCSLSLSLSFIRIIIKDVDVSLFRSFLEYLYGKPLDYANMSKEEIIELLAIADRYEVQEIKLSELSSLSLSLSLSHSQTSSLHSTCEQQLINRIDNSNVFSLLIVADQFSARQLRVRLRKWVGFNYVLHSLVLFSLLWIILTF